MSCCPGLNRGPLPYHGSALPAELQQQNKIVGRAVNSLNDLLLPSKHPPLPVICVTLLPYTISYSFSRLGYGENNL